MTAIKQGHRALLQYRVGSDSDTCYMLSWKKPITTRISIRSIRLNEPNKIMDHDDPYLLDMRNSFLQKRKISHIHVVRGPIEFGTCYILIDGHHRLEAAKMAGLVYLDVIEYHHTDVEYGIVV